MLDDPSVQEPILTDFVVDSFSARLVAAEDICSEVTNEKSQEMRTSAETADKQSHQLPTRKPSPEVGDQNWLPSATHAPPAKKESAKVCPRSCWPR